MTAELWNCSRVCALLTWKSALRLFPSASLARSSQQPVYVQSALSSNENVIVEPGYFFLAAR